METSGSRDVLRLTEDLIAIESHAEAPGRERTIGSFLIDWFTRRGIEAALLPVIDERSNVMARLPGGSAPPLLLCGHLDTVPAGNMENAFLPTVRDGVLWGRGACDMKGAVAAMCCTLAEVGGRGRPLRGDLWFAGTVDEESGGLGVKALVESGFRARHAVVGEPTGLRIALAHKGACFLRISLVGRGAHGSCPERGVSAVAAAARIVRAVETSLRPRLDRRTDPLLGRSTVSVGRVCGGTQPNIVAERCEIDIDRRMLPGELDPLEEIRALVRDVCDSVDGLAYEVEELPMTSAVPHVALSTDPASPVALAATAAAEDLGMPFEPIGVTYWTDGAHLAASGMDTLVVGPGDIAQAHGPQERVDVEDLVRATSLYTRIVDRLIGEEAG